MNELGSIRETIFLRVARQGQEMFLEMSRCENAKRHHCEAGDSSPLKQPSDGMDNQLNHYGRHNDDRRSVWEPFGGHRAATRPGQHLQVLLRREKALMWQE